jgi:hypothetical protein
MLKATLISLAILAATAASGHASARNYFLPNVNGVRLASCLANPDSCGKPAADAFCVEQGFSQAIMFQREPASSTVQLNSDTMCEGASCTSFRQIKCLGTDKPADLAQN